MILNADARHIPLRDQSVHMVVTSPPYWSLRDYGVEGQIGLERTPEEYVAAMVAVFREVWRVLRDDGTLWLNLGDAYAGSWGAQSRATSQLADRSVSAQQILAAPKRVNTGSWVKNHASLKPKDLIGLPWMVAFALRADGWYLRSAITWCKKAPMPESIEDRPTSATEMIFLLTKSERYFYDNHGFREASVSDHSSGNGYSRPEQISRGGRGQETPWQPQATRNMRNFWLLGPEPYLEAHFAVFPSEIPRRAILLGTSERGCCPACGAGWVRQTERAVSPRGPEYEGKHADTEKNTAGRRVLGAVAAGRAAGLPHDNPIAPVVTTGWTPSCTCGQETTRPALVLDLFAGSGTVGAVCHRLGRRFVGLELNPAYCRLAAARTAQLGLI